MKQPHTEAEIQHTDDQQNTGNHAKPGSAQLGPDAIGGTRAGAENVEDGGEAASVEAGAAVDPHGHGKAKTGICEQSG